MHQNGAWKFGVYGAKTSIVFLVFTKEYWMGITRLVREVRTVVGDSIKIALRLFAQSH